MPDSKVDWHWLNTTSTGPVGGVVILSTTYKRTISTDWYKVCLIEGMKTNYFKKSGKDNANYKLGYLTVGNSLELVADPDDTELDYLTAD